MINYLQGTLVAIATNHITVDVHGIGYGVELGQACIQQLPALNSNIKIYTYLAIKEDNQELFGFSNQELKQLFLLLITVNGIGAKMAMNILAKTSPIQFIQAIYNDNQDYLTKLPGIGKKTAARIVLDLTDKINDINWKQTPQFNNNKQDAASALIKLGFKKNEVELAINDCDQQEDAGIIIKYALKKLTT